MVTKPNDSWRMCVDYRNLNNACLKDTYPLQNIDRLQCYYHAAQNSIARFNKAPLERISREDNKRVDILFKLSVTKKKSHQRSVIQIWLRHPSVSEIECLAIDEAEAETDNWMTPII